MIVGARTRSGVEWRGSSLPPPRLEVLPSIEALRTIELAWSRLASAADHSAAFLRPEWVMPWLKAFGRSRRLRFIAAWSGDELVGLFPLEGDRALASLQNDHTPETEMLVHPGHRAGVFGALLDWLARPGSGTSAIRFERLPAGSPNLQVLGALLRERSFFLHESRYWQARHTRVDGGFDAFGRGRSKNFRKQVKRADRARETHGIQVDLVTDAHELERRGPQLVEASRASWQGRSGNGAFTDDGTFYREMSDRFARAGALRLFVCRAGSRCVGYVLCIVGGDHLEALKSEFDETLPDLMVGWQIYRAMYEHAAEHGITSINSGSWVTEFKERWSTHEVDLLTMTFYPPTLAGSLRFLPTLGKELVKRVVRRPTVTRCYPLFDEVPEGRKKSTPPPDD